MRNSCILKDLTTLFAFANLKNKYKLLKKFNIAISFSETTMIDNINDLFELVKNKMLDKN